MITSQLEPIKEQTVTDGDQTYVIRSIDDLMHLDSYADMSDLEIEKLTNYKVAQAEKAKEREMLQRMTNAFQESLQAQAAATLSQASSDYQAALASKPSLTIMTPDEVANVMKEPLDES